ncbi:ABC transporter permease [Gordonia aquimaris]|uniref:Iron ABC transporter permease n=1 Tax=Gordonia aquimaris TaxID=2984863 RepID=A0A9X3D4Y9_9ACTN|nr:iron ABC transporter permease [Gordonia aquimaris]MCX2964765.1 iron ABC transporter permease [Gordonia aquimaris]
MARRRRAVTGRRLGVFALRLVPAAFILVFFLWPLGALVRRAVEVRSGEGIGALLRRTNAVDLLGFTLFQAAASTVLALVVAAPMVWLIARIDIPGSLLLTVVVTVPFVLPTVVVGVAFRALLDGPLAFADISSGLWPILLAHAFLNVAVIARVVGAAWRSVDPRLAQVAQTLGASRARAFVDVTLPRLLPAVGAAAALVFLFCSTSFGVIIILGNGEIRTLETEIYTQAVSYFRIPEAVTLSMLQIVVVVAALLLTRLFTEPGGSGPTAAAETRVRPRGRQWLPVSAALAWVAVVLVAPLAVLVVHSVRPGADGTWTLAGYRALNESVNGVTPLESLRYSLVTAALAMVIALVVGLLAAIAMHRSTGAWAAAGGVITTIPLGISAVTLGFGYLIVLAALPREVAASPLVIPCVQALIAIPVVVRVAVPALESVSWRLRQAAMTLGASPLRVFWTVDLPMIGRSLGAAGGFAFVMALGEFGATSFLARADTTTLPVLIGSALNRPGAENLATAMAASVVLVAVTTLAVTIVEALRPRQGALL